MNIKTLSEVYFSHIYSRRPNRENGLAIQMWESLAHDLMQIAPEKAFFAKVLGQQQKDPMRILAMLLLNLSWKELLELQKVLGTLEPTQPS